MTTIHTYQCPVCAFSLMDEPPIDHAICACCGTHFGYQDVTKTHQRLRNEWLSKGGHWFDIEDAAYPPFGIGWNAWDQLDLADFPYNVRRPITVSSAGAQNHRFYIALNGFHCIPNPREEMTASYA